MGMGYGDKNSGDVDTVCGDGAGMGTSFCPRAAP